MNGAWGGENFRRRVLAVAWRRRARAEVSAADADFFRAVADGRPAAEVWAAGIVAEHAAAEHAAAARAVHAATRSWFAARRDAGPYGGRLN